MQTATGVRVQRHHVGRPLKFGEPMVKREFRLAESLSERLSRAALGRDVSDIVREAIEEKLNRDAGRPAPTMEQLRQLVEEAQAQQSAGVQLDLTEAKRVQLETMAASLGYKTSDMFVRSLVNTALAKPEEEVKEWTRSKFKAVVEKRLVAKRQAQGKKAA